MSKKIVYLEKYALICYSLCRVEVDSMEEINTRKKHLLLIASIIMLILVVAGGTYAFLNYKINATNNVYNSVTHCLIAEYGTDNGDNTHDLTGTLFPSSSIAKGIKGRVSVKISNECDLTGVGTLKLHINNTTSSKLTTVAESYCALRKTGEKLTEYTTQSACEEDSNKRRWYGYGDSYCENSTTLQRLVNYKNESDCTSNSGVWKTGGSPLKYAVYDNADATGNPLSVGIIKSTDINHDIDIYTNFTINNQLKYYYVYIWLDGYLSDESYAKLPFDGYISVQVVQNHS